MTEATFTKFRSSATFDVVSTVSMELRPDQRLDSAINCTEWAKYCGACPVWIWCINVHYLYLIKQRTDGIVVKDKVCMPLISVLVTIGITDHIW